MEEEDRPLAVGIGSFSGSVMGLVSGCQDGLAGLLARESLDPLSGDELTARIALLEAEIARVTAHRDRSSAHRLTAEALFRPKENSNS